MASIIPGRREIDVDEAGKSEDQIILDEAKERFKRAQNWESDARQLYIDDTKFANGDSDNGWQWPDNVKEDRDVNNRPCLTVNKVKVIVNKLANEAKLNPPEPRLKPVGGRVSFDAAQIWEGLLRHIMYVSNGQGVMGQAKEHQLEGGIGYWMISHDYVDDNSFDQEIRLEPLDPPMVYLDCDIQQTDGSDAMWGFVFRDYNRKEFERQFPQIMLPPTSASGLDDRDDWIRKDGVRTADYYRIKITEEELVYIEDEQGKSWTGLKKEIPAGTPWRQVIKEYQEGKQGGDYRSRKVKHRQLQWFKIAGNEITERDTERKGKFIPIIREVGRERKIDGRLHRAGLVRALKDPQRMYNYNDLELSTPLPTPFGWTTIGDVKSGDVILSDQGKPTRVTAESPVFINRRCYSVKFDDGSEIIAGGEHLWTVEERGKRKAQTWDWSTKTITTNELTPKKHFIWAVKPLDLPLTALPIDPYVFGAWLGDGYSNSAAICSGLQDADAMEAVLRSCRHPVGDRRRSAETVTWTISGIKPALRELGVLNNKHIPLEYLRASREQREALLQGLMDTDGHFSKHSRQNVFVNVNPRLADGFAELVRSLGLKATYTKIAATMRKFPSGDVYECQESFRFSFSSPPDRCIYRLPRKAAAHDVKHVYHPRRTERHRILSITEVPSRPTKCITVDAPSKLYLAGWGMIPTHNTSGEVEVVALQTKSPWVVPAAAIEGNEAAWAVANTTNAAYLTYKHIDDEGNEIPKPERLQPPAPAQGFMEGLRIAASELEMASGITQAQQENPSLERTPKAIGERMRTGEIVNYDFTTNEMFAVRHTAVVILDLAPHIYDTKSVRKIRARDGTVSEITIDPDAPEAYSRSEGTDPEDKEIKVLFNPKIGKYAIEADVGPAYQTQRDAAWDAFVQIITHSPELIAQIGDLGFLAADFPMAQEIADRLRRNIEQTMPWLLKDSQTGPLIQKLTTELQNSQSQVAELVTKLAEERVRGRGKEELRDIESFNADTKRMEAEIKALKELLLSPQQKAQMEHELGMRDREHVYTMIEQANEPGVEEKESEA